mgnify:CR=1 FL=1
MEGYTIQGFAEADLSSHQFKFVEWDASDWQIGLPAGDTSETILGVLLNKPGAGEVAVIQVSGVCWVIADEVAIAPFKAISTDTNGLAKLAASGDALLGYVYEAPAGTPASRTTAAGEMIRVFLYDQKSTRKP